MNLTAAYQGLLQSGVTDGSGPGNPGSLTLGGLTNGASYQVEVWVNESANNINGLIFNPRTILTATNAVTLDDNTTDATGGVGQWVTGTFTASGTSQLISLTASASAYPDINAVQVRTVPEPSTTVALLGGLGVLAARRRRPSRPSRTSKIPIIGTRDGLSIG